MEKKIYLISGLGADERVFEHIKIEGFKPKHIKWVEPRQQETIKEYAARLREQIDTENPIILGVSFGGMIAIEIAKQIDYEQIILISSAKTKKEIPHLYRFLGLINLHKLVPISVLKSANFLTFWLFGMETNKEKEMLKSILRDTDNKFLKWAINAIIKWDNDNLVKKLTQIHGQKDRILPKKNVSHIDFNIQNGGHLMIYNRADKINEILKKVLDK